MIHPSRSVALSFRVTPDELEVLKQMSQAADQTVSELIRSRLFDYAAVPMAKREPEPAPIHDGRHGKDCGACAPLLGGMSIEQQQAASLEDAIRKTREREAGK